MGLVNRMVAGAERRSALAEPPDWMWDAFGGTRSESGETVNERTVMSLIAVAAAVKILSSSVAQCPLLVYQGSGRGRLRADTSPQWELLHERPNSEHPPDLFFETLTGHENLWGNYFAEKVKAVTRPGGVPVVGELWPVAPYRVQVERDKRTGEKRFWVDGETRSFGADTILHIPAFGYDGMKGLSPIQQARDELGAAISMSKFIARAYANQGRLSGVLQLPVGKTLQNDERKTALRAQWRAMMQSADGTAILEDGTTWQQIGMPIKDLEYVATTRVTVNAVARMFVLPPEMIGGDRDSSMTYATVEGQALHFVKFSVVRWLTRIEQGLKHDRDLFPEGVELYPEFLVEGLLRGDSESRAKFYKAMWEMQVMTVNEIAERENLEQKAWGDERPQTVAAPIVAPADTTRDLARDLLELRMDVRELRDKNALEPS